VAAGGEDLVRLVLAAQSGDPQAFETLVRMFQGPVSGFCRALTRDAALAEDAAQETFLLVYRRLASLRNPAAFRSWMYRIAEHTAISGRRRRGPKELPLFSQDRDWSDSDDERAEDEMEEIVAEPEGVWGPGPEAPETPRVNAVRGALDRMPAGYAGVLTLHYVQEMSCLEIGETLGISTNNVKQRLHRARNALRRDMAQSGFQEMDGAAILP
jgi:RNA polymerase sigma-70 factor (ECF subfamily)